VSVVLRKATAGDAETVFIDDDSNYFYYSDTDWHQHIITPAGGTVTFVAETTPWGALRHYYFGWGSSFTYATEYARAAWSDFTLEHYWRSIIPTPTPAPSPTPVDVRYIDYGDNGWTFVLRAIEKGTGNEYRWGGVGANTSWQYMDEVALDDAWFCGQFSQGSLVKYVSPWQSRAKNTYPGWRTLMTFRYPPTPTPTPVNTPSVTPTPSATPSRTPTPTPTPGLWYRNQSSRYW
jgi:hypothetical protein